MFRVLKALPLTLALSALSFFATSCGSGSQAQIRVINAVPDAQEALDVDINGTKVITALAFETISPSTNPPATYTGVTSGTVSISAVLTGTSGNTVNNCPSCSLGSGTQYTVVLNGFASNDNPPAIIPDNNTAPTTGSLEFRVIDGSANTPIGGFDVYIVSDPNQLGTPAFSGLTLGQSTSYLPFANGSWTLVVTPHGNTTPIINQEYSQANGSITTLVVVDTQGGGSINGFPLAISDLD